MFLTLFIAVQVTLLLFMVLHDWLDISPYTDIEALKKHHTDKERMTASLINGGMVAIPLILTFIYMPRFPGWVVALFITFYGLLTIGTICAWWIPYLFGSSDTHKQGFAEYRNTHHFLPARGDNIIPNTLHVILHLQVWFCFACSIYLLMHG